MMPMIPLAASAQAQAMRPQQGAMPAQAQGNAYGRLGMRPPQAPITQMGQGVTPTPAAQPMAGQGMGQQVAPAAQQLGGTMGGRDRMAQQQFLSMLRSAPRRPF